MSESMNEKIAKLLRLAERAGTPAEAEAASKAAERLMMKWGIEEAVIRSKMDGGDSDKIVTKGIPFPAMFVKARTGVAHAIIRGMGGMKSYNQMYAKIGDKWDKKGLTVMIMGWESDVDRAITLINSLVLQADSAQATWWKEYRKAEGKYMKASEQFRARRQFLFSFAHAVEMRLRAMRAEEVAEAVKHEAKGTGTELVLLNREQAVEAEYDKIAGGMRKGRGVKGSWAGSSEGRAAGQRANLGSKGVGGSRRSIGS